VLGSVERGWVGAYGGWAATAPGVGYAGHGGGEGENVFHSAI